RRAQCGRQFRRLPLLHWTEQVRGPEPADEGEPDVRATVRPGRRPARTGDGRGPRAARRRGFPTGADPASIQGYRLRGLGLGGADESDALGNKAESGGGGKHDRAEAAFARNEMTPAECRGPASGSLFSGGWYWRLNPRVGIGLFVTLAASTRCSTRAGGRAAGRTLGAARTRATGVGGGTRPSGGKQANFAVAGIVVTGDCTD